MYLEFTEYNILGGNLTETAFNLLEYEARKKIDKSTFGRTMKLEVQKEEVKQCMFKLIDVLNENKSTIKSESVDGYSVSLMDKKDLETVLNGIIEDYLSECYLEDGTPYLYRGV